MIVTATVQAVGSRKEHTESEYDRKQGIYACSTIVENVEFTLEIEFTEGYVNLEGYAVDTYGLDFQEVYSDYFPDFEQFDKVEVEDYEISIWGNNKEWLDQAEVWISERPDHDMRSALNEFMEWKEVDSSTPFDAIDEYLKES